MKSYSLIINGQKYTTKVKKSAPGLRVVEVNGVDYEIEVEGEKEALESMQKVINSAKSGSTTSTVVSGGSSAPKASGGVNDIVSPIPGLIIDIKVSEGDSVKAGDLILTMEAMKMENEIKSTKDGKVSKIHVKKGDSVLEGQVMMTID